MSNKTVGTNPVSVAPPMKPHYSNSIRTAGPLLFIAGQVALDADGKLVGEGDIRESYFPADGPASAIVEVSALAWPEFLIEISAVTALPG